MYIPNEIIDISYNNHVNTKIVKEFFEFLPRIHLSLLFHPLILKRAEFRARTYVKLLTGVTPAALFSLIAQPRSHANSFTNHDKLPVKRPWAHTHTHTWYMVSVVQTHIQPWIRVSLCWSSFSPSLWEWPISTGPSPAGATSPGVWKARWPWWPMGPRSWAMKSSQSWRVVALRCSSPARRKNTSTWHATRSYAATALMGSKWTRIFRMRRWKNLWRQSKKNRLVLGISMVNRPYAHGGIWSLLFDLYNVYCQQKYHSFNTHVPNYVT